ncbi:MAG: type III-A CRISPR-associated protein Csm2 [Candidatus Ratteibacteria bacterium]
MKEQKNEFRTFTPDENRLKKIIKEKDMEELNSYAEELGNGMKEGLSTSQIRSILDAIQRMKGFDKNKLQLLRPKLAYAAGRHGGRVKEFQKIIEKAIQFVENNEEFENFRNFVEAIVAYHKFYGGKEN